MLLLCLCSTTAWADEEMIVLDKETNLIEDASQISSPMTEPSEGSIEAMIDGNADSFWHSKWSGGRNPGHGVDYFQVKVDEMTEYFGFTFTRRNNNGNQITQWSVYGVPADKLDAEKSECELLAEVETPCSNYTETLSSQVIESKGYTVIRFYEENTTGDAGFFHVAEFAINPGMVIEARDAIMEELTATYAQISEVIESMVAGTRPTQYDEAALAALQAAYNAAAVIDEPEAEELTTDQLKKLNSDLLEAYKAVQATRVPYAMDIKPGYYYLRAGLGYYTEETTEDTEDPETGETIPGESIRTYHVKGMYADDTKAMWGDLDKESVKFLWKIDAVADTTKCYTLTNMAKKYQPTATIGTLGAEGKPVSFDYAGESESDNFQEGLVEYYNIRLTTAKEREGATYIHQNNHASGAGKGSNIVGWYNTFDAELEKANGSEWVLIPVDEETAKKIIEGPATQIANMIEEAQKISENAPEEFKIAKDIHTDLNLEKGLITDASQFSSPWTQSKFGAPDGGELEDGVLIDNDPNTYWHSKWAAGGTEHGVQYLQISDIDTSIDGVAFQMVRRKSSSDHLSKLSVYGVTPAQADDEENKDELELLATLILGNTSSGATAITEPFETKGYSIIRIYEEETFQCSTSGCWHAAEIQLYPAKMGQYWKDGVSQYDANKALAEALQSAIDAWTAKEYVADAINSPEDKPFADDYKKVIDAYNAWKAVYVDPTDLRAAVEAAGKAAAGANTAIGNNPGQFKSADIEAVNSKIAAANDYDKAGKYTPKKSQEIIDGLAVANIMAKANPIQTGKWYSIRFGTEQEYEAAGWDKSPVKEVMNETANVEVSHALYGKVIAVAKHVNQTIEYTNGEGETVKDTQYNVEEWNAEDASLNAGVAFISTDELTNNDAALWQFIAIGDTAYVLQNKATGLYLRANGAAGATRLSVQPTTFNTSAVGYGKSLIKAYALTGEDNTYLHAERATNNLVTWNAYTVDSNSALYIEEKGDVTEQPSNEFTMSVWPGQIKTMCYPTSLEAKDGQFYKAEINGTVVTLSPIAGNKANAGQPVVYIKGSAEGYKPLQDDKEKEGYNADLYETATLIHGTEFVAEAGVFGALTGSFSQITIAKGNIWASNEEAEKAGFEITSKSSNTLGANTAYINTEVEDAEITIEISGNEVDGISNAIATVSKVGGIYTIDGKFVANGNINSLKNMPKGIYVVNGVKVAVK